MPNIVIGVKGIVITEYPEYDVYTGEALREKIFPLNKKSLLRPVGLGNYTIWKDVLETIDCENSFVFPDDPIEKNRRIVVVNLFDEKENKLGFTAIYKEKNDGELVFYPPETEIIFQKATWGKIVKYLERKPLVATPETKPDPSSL